MPVYSVHPRVCGADAHHLHPPAPPEGSPPRVRGRHRRLLRKAAPPRFTPACAGQTKRLGFSQRGRTVHPRVCGADVDLFPELLNPDGSPPRVRGRQSQRKGQTYPGRFTPACAGQTDPAARRKAISSVHPRVCGADFASRGCPVGCYGSPPRVRGRRLRSPVPGRSPRFTPACAGQTARFRTPSALPSVHPRVCGADGEAAARAASGHGSPPRVRGRLGGPLCRIAAFRFTPACAGQTGYRGRAHPAATVHPRVCGADFAGEVQNLSRHGSPPRVRGRPDRWEPCAAAPRFTPACAGQTLISHLHPHRLSVHPRVCGADSAGHVVAPGMTVHPRVCGADLPAQRRQIARNGSPPRVRGRLPSCTPAHTVCRFTPACAGQTRQATRSCRHPSVHPRVCGADRLPTRKKIIVYGSPPRVRGRLNEQSLHSGSIRFTPACAGQTDETGTLLLHQTVHPRVCGADGGYHP